MMRWLSLMGIGVVMASLASGCALVGYDTLLQSDEGDVTGGTQNTGGHDATGGTTNSGGNSTTGGAMMIVMSGGSNTTGGDTAT